MVGAVCLYDQDSDQGALLEELQRNLRLISVVVCLAATGSVWGLFHVPFPGGSGPLGGNPHGGAGGVHPSDLHGWTR